MRILISLSYYFPNISGLTTCAKELAEGLAGKKHKITVLTSRHKRSLLSRERICGVTVIRAPVHFKLGKGPLMLSFPYVVWKAVEEVDVVNCHLPQFESFILAIVSKIKHKKLLLTYQTDLSWDGGLLLKISKIFVTISHLISALLADAIVASSNDYAENSWFLRLFNRKLKFIYPASGISGISREKLQSFEGKQNNKNRYKIGILARLAPEKGIEYLLKAIPYLINSIGKNFIILIAGPKPIGENLYFGKIQKLLKIYESNVKLVGEIREDKLTSFYKSLDVFVLPSINTTEAFGIVQIEAMLNGIPVVASDLPGVRIPVCVTGMGEIAKAKDSKDLAEKIALVLRDRKKYLVNKSNMLDEFSLNKTILAYENLFSKSL